MLSLSYLSYYCNIIILLLFNYCFPKDIIVIFCVRVYNIHICVCAYVCVCVCVYVCVCDYIYMCVCIYIYTYMFVAESGCSC